MPQPHLSPAYCDAYKRINALAACCGRAVPILLAMLQAVRADLTAIGIEPGALVGDWRARRWRWRFRWRCRSLVPAPMGGIRASGM